MLNKSKAQKFRQTISPFIVSVVAFVGSLVSTPLLLMRVNRVEAANANEPGVTAPTIPPNVVAAIETQSGSGLDGLKKPATPKGNETVPVLVDYRLLASDCKTVNPPNPTKATACLTATPKAIPSDSGSPGFDLNFYLYQFEKQKENTWKSKKELIQLIFDDYVKQLLLGGKRGDKSFKGLKDKEFPDLLSHPPVDCAGATLQSAPVTSALDQLNFCKEACDSFQNLANKIIGQKADCNVSSPPDSKADPTLTASKLHYSSCIRTKLFFDHLFEYRKQLANEIDGGSIHSATAWIGEELSTINNSGCDRILGTLIYNRPRLAEVLSDLSTDEKPNESDLDRLRQQLSCAQIETPEPSGIDANSKIIRGQNDEQLLQKLNALKKFNKSKSDSLQIGNNTQMACYAKRLLVQYEFQAMPEYIECTYAALVRDEYRRQFVDILPEVMDDIRNQLVKQNENKSIPIPSSL